MSDFFASLLTPSDDSSGSTVFSYALLGVVAILLIAIVFGELEVG
jgi:hypothetical protein